MINSFNNPLFIFGKYPITRAVNLLPGKWVCDRLGNVYKVGEERNMGSKLGFNLELVIESPLNEHEFYEDLTEMQMELYRKLCRYEDKT